MGTELVSEIDSFLEVKDNNSAELVTIKKKIELYQKKIYDFELNKK